MTKRIKKTLIFVLSLLAFSLKGQVMLPLFEEPVRLDSINSQEAEESMPLPYLDGEKMYFVRTYVDGDAKQRKQSQDVWSSLRSKNIWSFPLNVFDEINDLGNNAIIGTSKDGSRIYVFNSVQTRRKLAKGIAITEKQEDGSWSDLRKIEIEGFKIGDGYYSFYVNPDEDILLISMAPSNNTINEDIFVSLKENGEWGKAIHLGNVINTSNYELSPYIADDKKTLYFSSNGHDGHGSADVFMAYRLDDSWTNWTVPKNLGTRINSSGFDAYFIIGNNKEVYFTSNRDQEYSDIYSTKIITGRIEEIQEEVEETEQVEVSSVFILDKLPADSIKLEIYDQEGNFVEEVVTDAYGQFTYTKLNPEEVYVVKVAEQDVDDYIGSNIYFLDEEGNKTERYILGEEGFSETGESEYKEKVSGVLATKKKPLKNNTLVVFNDEGVAVDTIYTDDEGRFNYTKLEMDQRYTIRPIDANDSDMGAFEIILEESDSLGEVTGIINAQPQPIKNTELVVIDENNFPIDTITTNDDGEFEFLKLAADQDYSIIPVEELAEEVIEDLELILIDEDGDVLMVSDSTFENSFTVISSEPTGQLLELRKKIESTIEEIEAEDKGDLLPTELVEINLGEVQINSIVIIDGFPAANKKLEIYDQSRTLSATTETDLEGKFSYKKQNSNEVYLIRIVGRDKESIIESDIYFIDMNGDKTNRYVLTEEGLFAESGDSKYTEFVKGVFEYKEKPLTNNALVVFDEEGLAIDTIFTDEHGQFEYTKLELDKEYKIRPIGATDNDMGEFILVLEESDSTGAEITGTISTKPLPIKNTDLVVIDRNEFAIDTVTTDDDGEFRFLKLAVDQQYSIKPLELDEEVIEEAELLLIDEEGELISIQDTLKGKKAFTISNPTPSGQLIKLQAVIEETIIEEVALDDPSDLIDLNFDEVIVNSIVIVDGSPASNMKLEIYDPSKTLVKELETTDEGKFSYSKLSSNEVYLVKIVERDEESSVKSNIYFINEEGDKTARYLLTEEGYFAESGNSPYKEFVEGTLELKEQPLKNNALGVYDKEDVVVDTTYTDEFGRFEFTKPNIDEEYRIRPIGVSDSDMIDFELILKVTEDLADIQGTINTKSQPIKNTDLVVLDGNEFAIDTVTTDDDGEFKYLKLAVDQEYSIVPVGLEEEIIEEVELVLIDEDGEVLSSSDNTGENKFTFKEPEPSEQLVQLKLKIEETIIEEIALEEIQELEEEILIPEEIGDEIVELETENTIEAEVKEVDPNKESTIEGEAVGEKGTLVKVDTMKQIDPVQSKEAVEDIVEKETEKITELEEKQSVPKEQVTKEAKVENGIRIKPIITDSNITEAEQKELDFVVYFGFNKWILDTEDKETLLAVSKLLKKYDGVKAEIFGHTDNVGSEAVNVRVAQLRSKSVKNFLIRNGIETDRLKVTAVGEDEPVADNKTSEGRALNRRAEVDLKEIGTLLSEDFKKELAKKLGKEADYIVYFGFNKWILESEDEQTLLEVTKLLQKDANARAEIFGHTDSVGSEAVNIRVAKLRSLSARNFLIRNGIAIERLKVTSIGEAEPIADNRTKEGRALNRRAEVMID